MNNLIGDRIKGLLELEGKREKDLAEYLQLSDVSMVYAWIRGENNPKSDKIIKIAEFFKCSVDYLIGRTEELGYSKFNKRKPFDVQLKSIMADKNISQYRMEKDKICSPNHFHKWFKLKVEPQLETIVRLADYFDISVDYLLGRE